MAATKTHVSLLLCTLLVIASSFVVVSAAGNFHRDFDITWGDGRGKILKNGQQLTLSLDKTSGSGFQSKNEYLFGKIDMQLKLVPGNSAGTVTAYYLSSQGPTHDEIDFEFLGNVSGQLGVSVAGYPVKISVPGIGTCCNRFLKIGTGTGTCCNRFLRIGNRNRNLQVPVPKQGTLFFKGKGGREQQFHLWFDPTADFHTYSILWNPRRIIFSVDGTAIREFKNSESIGVPFPKRQPMRLYSSLWNADDWATQGGRVKADWSKAPFTASYRNFNANACVMGRGRSTCSTRSTTATSGNAWLTQELDNASHARMKWVQKNYMVYNYCTDLKRFPQGLPKECTTTS